MTGGDSGFRSEPGAAIAAIVAGAEPDLGQAGIAAAIVQAAPSRAQQRRLADALAGDPGLLTTGRPEGPPQIELLIRALRELGAQRLVLPRCAHCGQPRRLVQCDGSLRICSACDRRRRGAAEPCAVCGNTGQVAYRDQHGRPRCTRCRPYDPAPRCENCSRRMRHVPCVRCGHSRAVWTRTADGQPLCGSCSRQRVPCTACGSTRTVAARLPAGPLCSTCYRKNPASFQPRTECGTTGRLYHHGLCTRCASRQHLLSLLADGQGGLHPHAEAIYRLLAAGDPAWLMEWLTRGSAARDILAEISQASQPPSHADLDRHLPSRAAHHLRKVLVAGSILPDRDERLAGLERWAAEKASQVEDPAERRIVRSFATWHHLRRLRGDSQRQHITAEQSDYVHNEIRAALKLITWLRDNGTSLADCTQHDIDTWLTGGPGTNYHARAFVLWASRRGHTRDLDIPQHPRSELLTQIEGDERWTLVRGLLHDDTRAVEDRVAGLLVLLYGQPLARIARLTRGQIIRSPQQVQLLLGTVPLDLPEPLGELVRQLLDRTHGRAATARAEDQPWAFPGGAPGHPLSTAQLKVRLARLGIHGRSGRNTALMDLAAK